MAQAVTFKNFNKVTALLGVPSDPETQELCARMFRVFDADGDGTVAAWAGKTKQNKTEQPFHQLRQLVPQPTQRRKGSFNACGQLARTPPRS